MSRSGKNLKNVMLGVVSLASAWQFYLFVVFRDSLGALDAQGGGANLWLAIGAAVSGIAPQAKSHCRSPIIKITS